MLSKDEVDRALNIALAVNLVSGLTQECILIAVESYAVIALLSVVCRQSNGLRTLSINVLDVDVVELGVCRCIDHCSSFFVIRDAAGKARAVFNVHNIASI